MGGSPLKRRRVVRTVALVAFGGVLFALPVFLLLRITDPGEKDHAGDWAVFYRQTVSTYFVLPPEADVVSAQETQSPFRTFTVRFRLPRTKPPGAWIEKIARESGLSGCRIDAFQYDAGDRSLVYYQEGGFYAEKGEYEVYAEYVPRDSGRPVAPD
ncbi:MAG: hypothetical protein COZ06_34090 [Armatimonadetes bacterium CG_4_10_14_3_um_filter_66_18]|nr:MAG: hypothetical protein COZ57_12235 [Armatimonadetes bacterium CG_4_8_14_3_um_filter_66_20]PIY36900.1 MAG: hypothetical protein COZ06_34090 [Armatimonadetes bacterium CG_4_10_14_3_um_filter_66_18]